LHAKRDAAAPLLFIMLCGLYLLRHAGAGVELGYKLIQILGLFVYAGPVIMVIPLRVELLNGLALLLYPSIVLQVVYALAVGIGQLRHVIRADTMQMLAEVARGGEQRIVALLLVQLLHAAFVHNGAVGSNRLR